MSGTLKSAVVWSAAGTVVRLACGFLSIKVTAVYLGPAGLALVGQLNNFYSLVQSTIVNAISTAVVKMTAEAEETQPERAAAVIGTALRVVLTIGLVVAGVLLLGNQQLSAWLLGSVTYAPALVLLAVILPAGLVGALFTALFTARRRFDLVSTAGIVGTVLGAAVFITAAWRFGVWGALIGTLVAYPLGSLVAYWIGRRDSTTRLLSFWPHARLKYVRSIVDFYPMLLANAAAAPLAMVLVRGMLMDQFGEAQTGLWQATVRLSDMYTMIFLTALSMYSLPTLSAARSDEDFSRILRRLVALCAGVMVATVLCLFLLRDFLVRIIFTREFAPVGDLWPWQLTGDVFFLASWPMRSALVARGRQLTYIAVEVGTGAGMVALTLALVDSLGLVAANIAHAMVWACVFVCLVVLHRRELFALR